MSKSKINVLFVDHTPFIGGAQLVLADHITELDRRQFSPIIACTNTVPELIERYKSAGAIVEIIDMSRLRGKNPLIIWHFLRSIHQLRVVLKRHNIDLVVSNTTRASYIATIAVLGQNIPLIWWVRDVLYPKTLFKLLKFIPSDIIYVSKAIMNAYNKGKPKGRVVYVANTMHKRLKGVTSDLIKAERAKWGIGPNDIVVGFMGRLVAEKGPEDIIHAMKLISVESPQVKALIVGTGEGQQHNVEDECKQLVQKLGLQDKVLFTGFQKDEPLYYSLFDIYALTTRDFEPFATTVVQAMMVGKPVIGTDAGGTRELVVDNQTGLLIEPSNPIKLAEAIEKLATDTLLRQKLAENGQKRVLQYHKEETVTELVEDIYREALGRAKIG